MSDVVDVRAFTLWQPMASALVAGPKRVENRPKPMPAGLVGKRVLIHAGLAWKEEHAEVCRRLGFLFDADLPRGAIIGSVIFTDVVTKSDDPWFSGPFGYVRAESRVLSTPVFCKGAMGFWRPTPAILAACREVL